MDSCPLQYTAPTVIPETADTIMVKSVTLHGHGQFRRIKVEETPLDYALKSDHVEVSVNYCGLNFTDNYLRLGIIRNSNFPVIMGSECSGLITRVGEDVRDLQAGQKVLCLKMQGGLFRRFVHVPRKNCFVLREEVDLKDAVAIGLNFLIAHVCLYNFGRMKQSHTIFMHSIAGGVGTAVAELAKTIPLVKIYGTASTSKHERLNDIEVDRVFDHNDNYVEKVLELHPQGLHLVINSVGGCEIENSFNMMKRRALLINIGSNCTATYPKTKAWGIRPTWHTKYISSAKLISKNLFVAGLDIGRFIEAYTNLTQDIITQMFDLYLVGEIKPHVHAVIPFSNVVDGLKELCKRENFGKIILDAVSDDYQSGGSDQEVPELEEDQPGSSHHEEREAYLVAS